MQPSDYHRWYETDRGRWIGEVEFQLVRRMLRTAPGESVLDVGCGTGYFTHRFAGPRNQATGLDPNLEWLEFAAGRASGHEHYLVGRAERLPFADHSFDHVLSIAALCFTDDPRPGFAEILRVARSRFAVGLLNRRSTLWVEKGRGGGQGAYRGARWYTPAEIGAFVEGSAAANVTVRTAVFDARGGRLARAIEAMTPNALPWGALAVVAGEVLR